MSQTGVFHKPPPTLLDKLGEINWVLLFVMSLLVGVGLAALYSVAGGSWSPWAERHALRYLLGLGLIVSMAIVPLDFWLRIAFPAYVAAFVALALVPWIGAEALGAKRWLPLGTLSFQPSEPMKIALVLALAAFFQRMSEDRLSHPLWLLIPAALILAPVVLIVRQPDLGTALMMLVLGIGMLFLAGVNVFYFVGGGAGVLAAAPMAMPYLHDYQRRRIETFLDPSSDPLGSGYHVTQSKIAMGSGGVTGKGFLAGTQSQLDFLPEKHTDFIFTTIAEEWGFGGAVLILALFVLLFAVLTVMAMQTASRAGRLLIAGAMLSIFTYAAINIGMVSGALPVVGIPLPFISYGGTSMMAAMFGLGLAMSAYVHRDVQLPVGADPSGATHEAAGR